MIKNFTPRLYQQTILATCVEKNTLVVLPTGLGKTNVFLMLAAQRLKLYPESKILFLGPTRPLINQYYETFRKYFEIDEAKLAVFTGFVKPEKRAELSTKAKIIFSTPQGLENDIITKRINLEEFSLLGFDEAHRATGNYSYVWLAKQYKQHSKYPRVIALTASPGSDLEKIKEVCNNLFIEEVEVRTEEDPDVKPYIHETKINWIYLELPKIFLEIKKFLEDCYKSKLHEIRGLGIVDIRIENYSKRDLLALQSELHARIVQGEKDIELFKSVSLLAEAMKVQHALELLETQSISSLNEYLEELVAKARSTRVKAVKNLTRDLNFRSALIKARTLKELKIEHPKLNELKNIVKKEITANPKAKIIVFSQYRDSIVKIVSELNKLENVKAKMFVGQAKKKNSGLTQKKQIELLKEFENGEFNVICMTSVGEEGLDIPSVNSVIFYEPIPSAIRTIQRKGRTGRHEKGKIIVLIAKKTRDEPYRWSAFHKEKRMYKILDELKKGFEIKKTKKISDFVKPEQEVIVYADYREKGSGIIKNLIESGVKINLQKLDIGDYLLSSRVVAEHKTVQDFVDSIIDKRLLTQIRDLIKYECPLLIIEGKEDIYTQRNLHPNVIQGMIATIAIDYKISIIYTKNSEETAQLLHIIAKKEQIEKDTSFTLHSVKPLTLKEQQEYIISALPGVGGVLAKPLLDEFKSVKNIINASEEDLKKIKLIGDKKANKIKEVVESLYK
ncbi:DEAD/DEAH box helicase [Candidatus Woesearchaeota archaeon]|nr:DEAD/DEAH box helicase [Candidatus Woesearchaeota archaeon]